MKKFIQAIILLTFAFGFTFCRYKGQNSDLKEQSHGKSAKPNYAIVFPNDKVNRIDIKIDAEKWAKMQTDLKSNIGNASKQMPPPPNRNFAEGNKIQEGISENKLKRRSLGGPPSKGTGKDYEKENEIIRPAKGEKRMGPPPGGRPGGEKYEPVWECCNVYFNNQEWNNVGIRFKGNSSLRTTYREGIKKLSFKLDFDQFEDVFPEIKDQRFYGFKQLNLKNNYGDLSFMREKITADLFADFGLITANTSFCQVFVDYGKGPKYFGLYTLVEEVDDTVIETQYENENGNLYKPDGFGATFASDSYNSSDMNKKSNNNSIDYSDVQELNTVLNSSLRTENNKLWKSQLNEIFDVSVFLKWLAANTVVQNWDSYGKTFHNYYLYNNPSTKKLEWIPWDNNEAFQAGKMGGALSLSLNEVGEQWPLIRYIIDDTDWKAEYDKYVADFVNRFFNSESLDKRFNNYQKLISNTVIGEQGEQSPYSFLKNDSEFNKAVEFLKSYVPERQTVVHNFIKQQNL